MNKKILISIGVIFIIISSILFLLNRIDYWKQETKQIISESIKASFDLTKWDQIQTISQQNLPSLYPFNIIKNIFTNIYQIIHYTKQFQKISSQNFSTNQINKNIIGGQKNNIQISIILKFLSQIEFIINEINKLTINIESIPDVFFLFIMSFPRKSIILYCIVI